MTSETPQNILKKVKEEEKAPDELSIYILSNGVHTDLIVPTVSQQMDWSQLLKYENTKSKSGPYPWLAIGWGDKGFYLDTPTWSELKFSTAFKATFGFSTSAIHATYYSKLVENEDCIKIDISKEQYARLIQYIKDSLQQKDGEAININTTALHNSTDAFYEAKGKYSLLYTCNSWANEGLKTSGQKACLWTAFENPIFLKYN